MDLDIERQSSRRVRSFDPVEFDAPRRPYFNESSSTNGSSWQKMKETYKDGRPRAGSIQSPRPPRHVVVPSPKEDSADRPKARRRSKSAASPSVISISSTSNDDDHAEAAGTFSAVSTSGDDDSSSSSSSSGSESTSDSDSDTDTSSSSGSSSTSSSTESDSYDDTSSSSAAAATPSRRAHGSKSSVNHKSPSRSGALVPVANNGAWRPSYNEESIAAASAAAAILEKERELKQMELELIKEKRDFAKEVRRRASAPLVFEREEDALAQMQRLVTLEGGDASLDDYLAATEKTATFLDDAPGRNRGSRAGAATAGAGGAGGAPRSHQLPKEDGGTVDDGVRGTGMNRVSAYQAQQRLMGSAQQRVGVMESGSDGESAGDDGGEDGTAGGLNDSRTLRRVPVLGAAEDERQTPHARGGQAAITAATRPTESQMYGSVDHRRMPQPSPTTTARPLGTPANAVPVTVTMPATESQLPRSNSSRSRSSRSGERHQSSHARQPSGSSVVSGGAAAAKDPSSLPPSASRRSPAPQPGAPSQSQSKAANTGRGVTVTLTAASPLNEQPSPPGPGSGVASPTYTGTPAVVNIQSDQNRSDTSASLNDVDITPDPRKPRGQGTVRPARISSASQESGAGTDTEGAVESASPSRSGWRKKKVRVRVRRRSRSRRKSHASAATESTVTAPPPPQFLSPTPMHDAENAAENAAARPPHRTGWLMPPPAEQNGGGGSGSRRTWAPGQDEPKDSLSAGPQYVQAAIPAPQAARASAAQPQSWAAAPANWPMADPPGTVASDSTAAQSLRYLTASGPVTDRQFKRLLCAEYIPADAAVASGQTSRRQSYEPFGEQERRAAGAARPSVGFAVEPGTNNNNSNDDDDDSFVVDSPPSSIDGDVDDEHRFMTLGGGNGAAAGGGARRKQSAGGPRRQTGSSAAVLFPAETVPSVAAAAAPPPAVDATAGPQRFTAVNDSAPPGTVAVQPGHEVDSDGSVLEFPPPPPTTAPDMPAMDHRPVYNGTSTAETETRCCHRCRRTHPDEEGCCTRCCHWWCDLFQCIFCCCCNRRKRKAAQAAEVAANNAHGFAPAVHNTLGNGAVAPVLMPEQVPQAVPDQEATMR